MCKRLIFPVILVAVLAGGSGVDGQSLIGRREATADNSAQEGPETIELMLSSPTGAKLGSNQTPTYAMIDDEPGPTYTNSLGMEFVLIMPGSFTMGGGDGHRIQDSSSLDFDEQPAHTVRISKPFYMLKTKVSQTHYQQAGLGGSASDVSWEKANAFCEWLSDKEGVRYHLPTEAQWEYVYESPGAVQDMSGREWVQDWHGVYPHIEVTDPVGPSTGVLKVIRSGEDRQSHAPNATSAWAIAAPNFTFRMVMEFDEPENPFVGPPPFCQAAVRQSKTPALQGPDPGVPYFTVRFAMSIPPDNSENGVASILGCCPSTMYHNHSPGFEVLPNGDALAIWFSADASYNEFDDNVRFVQARLRYGSDRWDLPELFYDIKHKNEQSGLLWTEGDTVWFFGGGRTAEAYAEKMPFKVATSTDSGATWQFYLPVIIGGISGFDPQPITNAFRSPAGDIYFAMDGIGGSSFLWRSSDGGVSWRDMGGRTNGRHSTIVPLGNGTLLSMGGKNTDIDGYMPQCTSSNWGGSWGSGRPTPFAPLGSNQRPSVIKLANGKLCFVSDCQDRHGNPGSWSHGDGVIVALSDDNGNSWQWKKLPVTLPHESDGEPTLGYSTVRQAPNGVIHILTTMTHPCIHYELNEAWISSGAGDIPPETTGGTVQQYSEYYPGGALKARWSARICPNGRYLLHGRETSYYESGRKEHEVTYVNGRKDGFETYWAEDGTRLWCWEHDRSSNTSAWIHLWSNGFKRIESRWNTYPWGGEASRYFSGMVANGPAFHWGRDGTPSGGFIFGNGRYEGVTGLPDPQTEPYQGPTCGADFNGDRTVDASDLAVLSGDWLKSGSYELKGTEPDAGNLHLRYSFDGSLGSDVPSGLVDDTGSYTATIVEGSDSASTVKYAQPAGAYGGGGTSAEFNNNAWYNNAGDTFLIPNSGGIDFGSFSEFTVGLFINPSSSGSGNYRRLFSEYVYAYMYLDPGDTLHAVRKWGGGYWNENWTVLSKPGLPMDGWSHLAMTWDADASGDRFKLYVDGLPAGSAWGNSASTLDSTAGFTIGGYQRENNSVAQFFSGKIDEFRLYDRALSEDEIIYMANNGQTLIFVPLTSPANLYEDDVIDFRDFAVFAGQWLESCE